MARRRFIAQDRWCEICSQPAALLVGTIAKDDNQLRPVCSYPHGEMLITQLGRVEDAEKHSLEHDDLTNA